ncbi:MAG: proteasome subunit beta [Candidatus Diapherotrites archaeon]|nr:proteasome subunit beta [Candidatus Diapherotrites archaeon]
MEEVKTGTTIVGIKGKDFVVLAADKQSTYGSIKFNKHTRKIHPIADYMALATAGLVGDAQIITRFLESRVRSLEIELGEKPSPRAIAKYLGLLLNANKYFPFWVGLILGGYKDEPYLASIDAAGGISEPKHYTAEGSGMPYALAVLESEFKENIKKNDAVKLAVKAVEASRKLDIYSGGEEPGIDVAIIDGSGVSFLEPKDVEKIKKALRK